jgi:hypothetical protein
MEYRFNIIGNIIVVMLSALFTSKKERGMLKSAHYSLWNYGSVCSHFGEKDKALTLNCSTLEYQTIETNLMTIYWQY